MGLFDILFPKSKQKKQASGYFQLLNGYTPSFITWNGALYENDLVRSAIDARARHISKLRIGFNGSAQQILQTRLKKWPNRRQTWNQFLYRLSTILDMQNTAFILPEYDEYMRRIGIITFLPDKFELVNVDGNPWVRFHFSNGRYTAEELKNIGILTKFQYGNDLFGEENNALDPTMQLITIQNQGIETAAKNSASYKFYAKLSNFTTGNDLKNEREKFSKENFSEDSTGGMLLFPNTYSEITQLKPQTYSVDPTEREVIQGNVYRYFGVNKDILENSATGDQLDAFFNGAIEPFQIQLSEVLTKLIFTETEVGYGSHVFASANRLQYMTTNEKVSMVKEIGALGGLKLNEIRDIFNLDPLDDANGEKIPIRGEYYFVGEERPAGRIDVEDEVIEDPDGSGNGE